MYPREVRYDTCIPLNLGSNNVGIPSTVQYCQLVVRDLDSANRGNLLSGDLALDEAVGVGLGNVDLGILASVLQALVPGQVCHNVSTCSVKSRCYIDGCGLPSSKLWLLGRA